MLNDPLETIVAEVFPVAVEIIHSHLIDREADNNGGAFIEVDHGTSLLFGFFFPRENCSSEFQ
jgi:hypothetical protein